MLCGCSPSMALGGVVLADTDGVAQPARTNRAAYTCATDVPDTMFRFQAATSDIPPYTSA